jgi:hypothetical protein
MAKAASSKISEQKLRQWVDLYLQHVQEITPEIHVRDEEGYKYRSVEKFQKNFSEDASDFAAMLDRAIENTNLVVGARYFPRVMLLEFAQEFPEETKAALKMLFDQSKDVGKRLEETQALIDKIMSERNKKRGKKDISFMGLRFLTLMLSFRYPNACNAIKPREWRVFCRFVDETFAIAKHTSIGDQYKHFEKYIEPLRAYIKTLPQIRNLRDQLTRGLDFRDDEFRWMTQDVIYVTARVLAKSKSEPESAHEVVREPDVNQDEQEKTTTGLPSMQFPLEEYLENLMVKNWDSIDFGEKLELFTDEDGTPGQQYVTEVGIIDILARSRNGDFVVIELKRGSSDSKVIGQVLAYIDWVQNNLAEKNQKVRGMVIAASGNKALLAARNQVADKVSLKYYSVKLQLKTPAEIG